MTALRHILLLAVVAATIGGSLRGQQQPITICVPAATPDRVGELLRGWFGDDIAVEPVASLALAAPVPAEPRIWLLWDEWTLLRAAAAGAQVLALPFREDLVFVAEPGVLAAGDAAPTWEAIAMAPALHDRLGLVAPEVDGGTWLVAMQQRLARGEGVDSGYALWTTLDARAGSIYESYATLTRDLAAGRLGAGIGPRRVFEALLRDATRLQAQVLPGRCARGLAVAAVAGERLRRIAAGLQQPDRLRALAAAAGVTVVDDHPAPLDPARAREWWQRFASHVRGRGRGAEQLADWLDVVFGVGFLVCAWFVYRALRRTPEPD
jgi:hypothetical protein